MNLRTANNRRRRLLARKASIFEWVSISRKGVEYRKYRMERPRFNWVYVECRGCKTHWETSFIEKDGLCPMCH